MKFKIPTPDTVLKVSEEVTIKLKSIADGDNNKLYAKYKADGGREGNLFPYKIPAGTVVTIGQVYVRNKTGWNESGIKLFIGGVKKAFAKTAGGSIRVSLEEFEKIEFEI